MNSLCNPYFYGYKNLNDLINGISLTITSANKNFDYTEAYLLIPEIIKVFYSSIETEPCNLRIKTRSPNENEIESTLIMGGLIIVSCISPNENRVNHHIHIYAYGFSNHSIEINSWTLFIDNQLKKLKPISNKNRYSVVIKPVTDNIDKSIREENSYQPLVKYISNPEYDSFMHYLIHKNNKQLIYHYC